MIEIPVIILLFIIVKCLLIGAAIPILSNLTINLKKDTENKKSEKEYCQWKIRGICDGSNKKTIDVDRTILTKCKCNGL